MTIGTRISDLLLEARRRGGVAAHISVSLSAIGDDEREPFMVFLSGAGPIRWYRGRTIEEALERMVAELVEFEPERESGERVVEPDPYPSRRAYR